ncbi:MAG: choice-of-anchor tandem repeat GloVer-containing protein [Isosphaeraceae bacterium]
MARRFHWARFLLADTKKRRRRLALAPSAEIMEPRCLLSGSPTALARAAHLASISHRPVAAALSRARGPSGEPRSSNSASDTVLHSFGGTIKGVLDGLQPWGSLTLVKTHSGPIIFGRTTYGGSNESNESEGKGTPPGNGVIFTMKLNGSDYTIVHTFAGGASDGAQPHHDQLRQEGNVVYGATLMGGSADLGVVFSIKTDGTGYKILHCFQGGTADGALPHSNPMPDGSMLYGLTSQGGTHGSKGGDGTIYAINTKDGRYKMLYSFSKSDGTDPHGFVIVDHHNLYGMTRQDGSGGDGTIFDYNLKTNSYTLLHAFTGSATDGSTPDHGGLLRIGHTLYGLTTEGGMYGQSEGGYGVLFRIDESGKNFKVLHSFGSGTDGIGPHGSLILYKGKLYGMTSNGGTQGVTGPGTGDGTIFQINPSGKHYKVIYNFNGPQSDGNDGLDNVFIADGTIFGMTKDGGPNVTPDTSKRSSPYQSGVIFALPLPNR